MRGFYVLNTGTLQRTDASLVNILLVETAGKKKKKKKRVFTSALFVISM